MKFIELYPKDAEKVLIQETPQWHWGEEAYLPGWKPPARPPRPGVTPSPPKLIGPNCNRCARSKTRKGKAGIPRYELATDVAWSKRNLLVVLGITTWGDTESADYATQVIRRSGWKGNIIYDLAVRCSGGEVKAEHVDHCRPYLSYTFHKFQPERVLLCGNRATRSFLGQTLMVHVNRGCWQVTSVDGRKVPIVSTCDVAEAIQNHFYRDYFWAETAHLLSDGIMDYEFPAGWARVIQTVEDAEECANWVEEVGALSYDCETSGELFDPDFYISSIAFSHYDYEDVYVLYKPYMTPAIRHVIRKRVFTNKRVMLSGWNLPYDMKSVYCDFGVDIANPGIDGRLVAKARAANIHAKLDEVGPMYGLGQHKREAEKALAVEKAKVNALQKAVFGTLDKKGKVVVPKGFRAESMAYAQLEEDVQCRYVGRDAQNTDIINVQEYGKLTHEPALLRTWEETIKPAMLTFYEIEKMGMLTRREGLELADKYIREEVKETGRKLEQWGIDPDCTPDSIIAFFDREGIQAQKLTATGKVSTNKAALVALQAQTKHEAIAEIMMARRLMKLLTAYTESLPRFIRPDGRVHPSFLLDGTESGRAACHDPAMHGIPSRPVYEKGDKRYLGKPDPGKMVRNIFCAPRGRKLVAMDFKSLEIFIAAIQSGDKTMIGILADNADFHTETACRIAPKAWGMSPDEARAVIRAEIEANGKSPKRNVGKTVGLGVLYGQGARSLSEQLGVPVETAQGYIDAYFKAYPGLKAAVDRARNEVLKDGEIWAYWGGERSRRRPLPNAGYMGDGRRKDSRVGESERAAFNHTIQSVGSDYTMKATIRINEEFRRRNIEAWIVMQIHDSIVTECDEAIVDEVIAIMVEVMTGFPSGPLKLQVECEVGDLWGSMKEVQLVC